MQKTLTVSQVYADLLDLGLVLSTKPRDGAEVDGTLYSSRVPGRETGAPPPTPDVEVWPAGYDSRYRQVLAARALTEDGRVGLEMVEARG